MKKTNRIKDLPAVDQPREKLEKYGISSLSETDLIALLLRSGLKGKNVIQLSKNILKRFTLNQLSKATLKDLISITGMGITRASSILAAFELGRRLEKEKKNMKPKLNSPEKIYRYTSDLTKARREKFIAIYFDSRMKVIKRAHISVGTVSASIVHPRDVYKPAVECNASKVVVVHNHPSGDVNPSREDISITKKLKKAGDIMGIDLEDHLIVTNEGYYSFKEKGII
ncbi:MAG: RadC family protein [Elusimicrobiota bacterium]